MCAQLVGDGLAHQPECVLRQPSIRGLGLVQLEFLFQQIAQAVQQLALQRVPGRRQCLAGIAAEFPGDRCLVGLHDQLAERAGMLILAGQHVQQRGPEVGITAQPVEDVPIEKARVEQPGGGAVQAVLALLSVTEAVGLSQRAVPGMPDAAVDMLDVQIDRYLADVVQQGGVGRACGPGLGLGSLRFRRDTSGQQMRLPQLEGIGHDLQAVVQHTARIGVVVVLGGRELLDQLGVALQWGEVERGELSARERRALPDVFQQFLPTRCRQQRRGRLRSRHSLGHRHGGGGWCTGGWNPFALEQREHDDTRVRGLEGEPFGLFG